MLLFFCFCFSDTYCTGDNYCLDKVHQFRMVKGQDIFKTPHQQDDELSEDDLLTTDQHKTFEGADNATIPLASKTLPASVTASTPGSVAVGNELGGGTNLMMGGLLND
jgi:hypothetical protein